MIQPKAPVQTYSGKINYNLSTGTNPANMNVLLIDDDRIFNLLNKKTLERMSMVDEIHIALNGEEALDLINDYFQGSRNMPDIILLDLNMPIMDGFGFIEAFQRLNANGKQNVRIVIVSSSQDPRDIERAKAFGITDYLTKPVTEQQLWNALGVPPADDKKTFGNRGA